ncbi:C40 family peptidase [Kordia algicida OT-1]|uniref:Probable lipoprotein NlpC n=1 Tax=Kordia algicida OT-1 TaxID=391587 RepID=A9DK42_9FLAO|nr:C40 family peptidase [Kordia algicida]EDP98253.1 probable lipoprotein NlpC precursor [Kordia algicida OT-1]
MIRKLFLLFFLSVFIVSCGSSKKASSSKRTKRTTVKTTKTRKNTTRTFNKANAIVETALAYRGTRYKYGGTNRKGMDCSGLMYTAFNAHNVNLPRVSYQQATKGKRIKLSAVVKGDLLFFQTNKNRKRINHVGLVISNNKGVIKFIHATTSKGVLISTMNERYWKNAYTEARRVL